MIPQTPLGASILIQGSLLLNQGGERQRDMLSGKLSEELAG